MIAQETSIRRDSRRVEPGAARRKRQLGLASLRRRGATNARPASLSVTEDKEGLLGCILGTDYQGRRGEPQQVRRAGDAGIVIADRPLAQPGELSVILLTILSDQVGEVLLHGCQIQGGWGDDFGFLHEAFAVQLVAMVELAPRSLGVPMADTGPRLDLRAADPGRLIRLNDLQGDFAGMGGSPRIERRCSGKDSGTALSAPLPPRPAGRREQEGWNFSIHSPQAAREAGLC